MRIEISVHPDGRSVVEVDGAPSRLRTLSWLDGINEPHPLVWVSRERQYDVELWLDGRLVGYVPAPDPALDARYAAAEERRSA